MLVDQGKSQGPVFAEGRLAGERPRILGPATGAILANGTAGNDRTFDRELAISRSRRPVVVVLSDGTRHKGMIDGFRPEKTSLRLQEVDHGGSMIEIHDIDMFDVQAVFFVRSLSLFRTYRLDEQVAPAAASPHKVQGTRLRVQFVWGEILDGVAYGSLKGRTGFFLFPSGSLGRASNIERVYVSRRAVTKIERLDVEGSRRAAGD